MTETILCVVAGFLVLWIVNLKLEIGTLQKNQTKLLGLLKRQIKDQTSDVEVTTFLRGWGKKAFVEEVDTSWVKNPGGAAGRQDKGG
ncbi:MAG: hypothetical protein NTY53_21865 [Kiritimatiellaeota bacterium]|nr:hypothetical protein [Kiritimatiellota bacterium]